MGIEIRALYPFAVSLFNHLYYLFRSLPPQPIHFSGCCSLMKGFGIPLLQGSEL